jgi:hypothetical protein
VENSNSRFETLEPVISAGSSVGNDSKTPVDPACLYSSLSYHYPTV